LKIQSMTIPRVSKKVLLPAIAILIVGTASLWWVQQDSKTSSQQTAKVEGSQEDINFDPPTKEEKEGNDQNKTAIEQRDKLEQPGTSPAQTREVKPTITFADQYGTQVEVGGYVNSVVEDGGTCTARFTRGSSSFSKTSVGVRNASSTNCPVITADVSEFSSKGTWSVVLSYASSSVAGSSDSKNLEVK
jgi:hypothetical protein